MCYSDPPYYPAIAYACPLTQGRLLDCNNDDYYHTDPPPDSYLATHWNVANSAFLTTQQPPNVPPVITLATPGDVRAFVAPARIPLIVDVADSDGNVVKVEFYEGTTLLATTTTAPFDFIWEGALVGSHVITAMAFDDDGVGASSAPLHVEVVTEPDATPPVVHLTMVAAATIVTSPMTITLSAEVTTTDAAVARVDFYAGEALLGSDFDAPYTVTWLVETSGTYTLTAQALDTRGLSATSPPLALVVAPSENLPIDERQEDEELPNAFYLPLVLQAANDE
jgi:hypothetical protein